MKLWLILISGGLLLVAGFHFSRTRDSEISVDETEAALASQVNADDSADRRSLMPSDLVRTPKENLASEHMLDRLALIAESDIDSAIAVLEQLPEGDLQRDLVRQLLTSLFEKDPVLAAELVARLHRPLDTQMAAALASVWVRKDIKGAVEWVRGLPPGNARSQALVSVCPDWSAVDPRSAAEFVFSSIAADFPVDVSGSDASAVSLTETSAAERLRAQMLSIIGSRWAANDSMAAATWAAQLPAGKGRDSFVAGLTSVLAENSPAEAAELVASMSPSQQQEDAALTVLLQWRRVDFKAAGDWIKLFPEGDFREKALLNLISNSSQQEAGSAESLLLIWPDAAERTRAIRQYLTENLPEGAERATGLLPGIHDELLLQEEMERVAQHWLMRDPLAARQWIARTDLQDSTKIRLLTAPGLPGPRL